LTAASTVSADDWIDAAAKRDLSRQLVSRFHVVDADVRLCFATCLVHLNDHGDAFEKMLAAESVQLSIQTYREKASIL
jgi:hypothetical protein